jgi:RNA polymerase sigma-70 factor (ECF subfamily)
MVGPGTVVQQTQLDDPRDIVRALRARDADGIEALFDRHKDRVFRYLLNLSRDRQTAEDLCQETWLRVLDRGHQYQPSHSFLGWLLTIARHLFIDLVRKTSPERLSELHARVDDSEASADGPAGGIQDGRPSPLDQLVARELGERVEQGFARLPPLVQEVLALRLDQGLSFDEIARVTSAPLSTVKARLYRGASALAKAAQEIR